MFNRGQLTEKAVALFQQLQKLKQEGNDISTQFNQLKEHYKDAITRTTSDSIVDTISDGFSSGFKSVQNFAGKTEDLIRGLCFQP